MVGMKRGGGTNNREKQNIWNRSAITTKAKQDGEQVKRGATANHEKTTSLELGDLMKKLERIDKKLKCSEEDRQMLKKEIQYNKNENLHNCFNLARAAEKSYSRCQTRYRPPKKSERNIS